MKIFILILLLLSVSVAEATTYYISESDGSDFDSGLTEVLAWKTLTKVNATTFSAGDQILFKRGDTFYGSLIIKQSGTAGNPIVYGAYGTGANPIITGFTTVTAWTNLGSNIWESTSAVSTLSTCNMVAINGVNTGMGRWPNLDAGWSGYSVIASHPTSTSLTSSSLTGTPNWTGAEAVIRNGNYTMNRVTITSQSASLIEYTPASGATANWGFFIQNHPLTLDQENEWYFNPTTKKIRVYSATQPNNVKVASVTNIISFPNTGTKYVTIENLAIEGANSSGITKLTSESLGDNMIVRNCSVSFSGLVGIEIRSNYLIIENCTISDCNNKAVEFAYFLNGIFRNNVVTNTGVIRGMGTAIGGTNSAVSVGSSSLCEYNTIINSGLNGIEFYGHDITIKNNYIDTYCVTQDDGAGIYTYTGTPSEYRPIMQNCRVTGNIVINGIGAKDGTPVGGEFPTIAAGIYCDYMSENVEIDNNTIINSNYYCLHTGQAANLNIHHNTLYDGFNIGSTLTNALVRINNRQDAIVQGYNIDFKNNILVSLSSNQFAMYMVSTVNNLQFIGVSDSNKYVNLSTLTKPFKISQPSEYGNIDKTLAEWKVFSGEDAHTTEINFSQDSITILYNETNAVKYVALNNPSIDINGNKAVGIITLQPYTSEVYFTDPNPAPPYVPPTGTARPAKSGSKHYYSGNRLYIF